MDVKSELDLILAGSPEELKANLPLLLAVAQIVKHYSSQGTTASGRPPINPEFIDYLMLTLHWRGISEGTFKNHTIEKSIRLKKIDPKTISLTALQKLGKQVISKFNDKTFKTGYCKCKYANYKQGVRTWGYFDKKETGYRIIEAMGDIGGFNVDKSLFRYEFVDDPSKAFDPTPSKITIAGKPVRPRAKAPIATMRWYGATITFPWIGHTEQLCNISGYVIRDLKFLDAYED